MSSFSPAQSGAVITSLWHRDLLKKKLTTSICPAWWKIQLQVKKLFCAAPAAHYFFWLYDGGDNPYTGGSEFPYEYMEKVNLPSQIRKNTLTFSHAAPKARAVDGLFCCQLRSTHTPAPTDHAKISNHITDGTWRVLTVPLISGQW